MFWRKGTKPVKSRIVIKTEEWPHGDIDVAIEIHGRANKEAVIRSAAESLTELANKTAWYKPKGENYKWRKRT